MWNNKRRSGSSNARNHKKKLDFFSAARHWLRKRICRCWTLYDFVFHIFFLLPFFLNSIQFSLVWFENLVDLVVTMDSMLPQKSVQSIQINCKSFPAALLIYFLSCLVVDVVRCGARVDHSKYFGIYGDWGDGSFEKFFFFFLEFTHSGSAVTQW